MEKIIALPGFDKEEAAKYQAAADALDAFRAKALRRAVKSKAAAILAASGWTPAAADAAPDADKWAAAALTAADDAPEVPEATAAAIVEDLAAAA
jgi:hypothetical protein